MNAVANPPASAELDAAKEGLETQLRADYAAYTRNQLRSHPLIQPYAVYFEHFDKTYHVQLQLESIALKGKAIPRVAALVEAMFMAELKNMLLTAGHDLNAIQGAIRVDVADGRETYITLAGQTQVLKRGDMYVADEEGILSSIIHGPGRRSRIEPGTTRILFTTYAPAGIPLQKVNDHLADLAHYVRLVAPLAVVERSEVVIAA